jgi:acyl-CoA thioester hydrolase
VRNPESGSWRRSGDVSDQPGSPTPAAEAAQTTLTDTIRSVAPYATNIRVRYAETDQMGVVYYANYLVWMEVARVEYCKSIGFRYKDMELDDGILLAVAEAHCRYVSPARFDDDITVMTTVPEANRRVVTFDYEIACGPRRIAVGQTRHIFLNREFRPSSLPTKYRPFFGIA